MQEEKSKMQEESEMVPEWLLKELIWLLSAWLLNVIYFVSCVVLKASFCFR
jgi:hypothetical protein